MNGPPLGKPVRLAHSRGCDQYGNAVYHNEDGKLIARAQKPDGTGLYEFEIVAFELLRPGRYT